MTEKKIEELAEGTFTFRAGVAVRKRLINYIKELSFMKDVKVEYEEMRYFLGSTFLVKLSGSEDNVRTVLGNIKNLADSIKSGK